MPTPLWCLNATPAIESIRAVLRLETPASLPWCRCLHPYRAQRLDASPGSPPNQVTRHSDLHRGEALFGRRGATCAAVGRTACLVIVDATPAPVGEALFGWRTHGAPT